MCTKFTIYGERCSGTNYLENLILDNFNIDITWNYGWKHFFGFYNFSNTEEENNTLFIGIIRNPITWIDSFFNNQHHINPFIDDINTFLTKEIKSTNDDNEIIEDRNYVNGKRYKNIFELRFYKNYYLINIMPQKVKNYILIKYEDLLSFTIRTLTNIETKFNLKRKLPEIKNIKYYKSEKNKEYIKIKINLSKIIIIFIMKHINKIQEKKIGYM